ncbi:MAG TPA: exosortase/archaeosortase family protein [Acidobacteriota bacterium]|nr:exosortase/archaeosortase family protein [Acidobacteriota bacterium]
MAFVKTNAIFILFSSTLFAINGRFLRELIEFALKNESSSHILIVPFISGWLLFTARLSWSAASHRPRASGIITLTIGIGLLGFAVFGGRPVLTNDYLTLRTLALLIAWFGGFLCLYGIVGFKAASFPLLFLVLMVPIPTGMLQRIIAHLQCGSATMAALLFKATGTPFFRDGTVFSLPGTNIDIAPECSGIRSSMALFITAMLAGYLTLRSSWRRAVFVLAAIPMAMLKNSVRIVTLCLLGIHVDLRILTDSNLHHRGGILFFILALLLMAPPLWILRRSESRVRDKRSAMFEPGLMEKVQRSKTVASRTKKDGLEQRI